MLLRQFTRHINDQNWFAVGLDVVVVVVGIFLGMQVTEWNEWRKERIEERIYLDRLQQDMSGDLKTLQHIRNWTEDRIKNIEYLESVAKNPMIAQENISRTIISLERAAWESYSPMGPSTYEELMSLGLTTLIQDYQVRKLITAYYSNIALWNNILDDFQTRHSFQVATEGLLSSEQLSLIENEESSEIQFPNMNRAKIQKLAQQFSDNQIAVNKLPRMLHYHVLVQEVIIKHEKAANDIISSIENILNK